MKGETTTTADVIPVVTIQKVGVVNQPNYAISIGSRLFKSQLDYKSIFDY